MGPFQNLFPVMPFKKLSPVMLQLCQIRASLSSTFECKWKILHAIGPFQNLIPVMLQLCQIRAAPKINSFFIAPPKNPSKHFGRIIQNIEPHGAAPLKYWPHGVAPLECNFTVHFLYFFFVFSYRCLFLSFFLSLPPKNY